MAELILKTAPEGSDGELKVAALARVEAILGKYVPMLSEDAKTESRVMMLMLKNEAAKAYQIFEQTFTNGPETSLAKDQQMSEEKIRDAEKYFKQVNSSDSFFQFLLKFLWIPQGEKFLWCVGRTRGIG